MKKDSLNISRNKALNLLKGLACIVVVLIHIRFPGIVGEIVWQSIASFAVPIFFMIAGYFAFEKDEYVIKKRMLKILKFFFIGYMSYLIYYISVETYSGTLFEWLSRNFRLYTPIQLTIFCTVSFLYPLWYLIAMTETYFCWYFIVQQKKELIAIKTIPFLFIAMILFDIYCQTKNVPWMFGMNFLLRAMPYFLLGYFFRIKEHFFKSFSFSAIIMVVSLGSLFSIIPIVLNFQYKISIVGNVLYSLGIFALAIKVPNKSYCKVLEYIGDKLSLNVYLYHYLVYFVIKNICNCCNFDFDIKTGLFGWIRPIVIVLLTLMFAQMIEMIKNRKFRTSQLPKVKESLDV